MLDGGQNTLFDVIEFYWMVVSSRENRRKLLPVYFLLFYVCNFGCKGMIFFQGKIQHETVPWLKIFHVFIKAFCFLFPHSTT